MEELGESLNSPLIPYPGKQLLPGSREHFFALKPEVKSRYIYDFGLSTGQMLYQSAGGIGFSKEKHILGLHSLMRMPYAESLVREEFENNFKGKWGPAKFSRLRRDVNQELKDPSKRTMAKLYCLLACTGFRHKFDKHGNFKGEYFPHSLDTEEIKINNKKLINSDFVIMKGGLNTFERNLFTKKSLIYFHLPFPSTEKAKGKALEFFKYVNSLGYDFLMTSRLMNRGRIDETISQWSKDYSCITIPQSEGKFTSSDIFITNF
jgi:hypothetical protein|tara:strand:+ start:226 stop:1014 length:789 start_codon:yes stop_codon:yes gene_type:complete